jgi:hypothetical protein
MIRSFMDWLGATRYALADWGNVPGWIAVALSALAVFISYGSRKASQRSADAAERSSSAAEQ